MKTWSNFAPVVLVAAFGLSNGTSGAQTSVLYQITGRVFDEASQGVEKVRVCAKPKDYAQVRMIPCGLSDANGDFAINVGRAAHFTIFPEKTAAGYQWQATAFYRNPLMPLVEVVLTESNRTAAVMVPLGPRHGSLAGNVTDASTRRPVEAMRFTMCHVANPRECWTTSVKNANGEFYIGVALVPFTLKITSEGYQDWWGPSGQDMSSPISVAPGERTELACLLRRRPETENRPLSEAEKLPAVNLEAPVPVSPADRAELKNVNPRRLKLEWKPVEGATSYAIEVDFCDGRDRSIRECADPKPLAMRQNPPIGILGTSYELDFVGMQPGRWRVWAIDVKGREGFKSPWRVFFYIP
jgi:hypothetical protein